MNDRQPQDAEVGRVDAAAGLGWPSAPDATGHEGTDRGSGRGTGGQPAAGLGWPIGSDGLRPALPGEDQEDGA